MPSSVACMGASYLQASFLVLEQTEKEYCFNYEKESAIFGSKSGSNTSSQGIKRGGNAIQR